VGFAQRAPGGMEEGNSLAKRIKELKEGKRYSSAKSIKE
jgi:hypothetical protein